jgi:peptidoglycan hydrolase-like protein with peptidoglycan-binding domain
MKNLYYLAGKIGALLLALTMVGSPALVRADSVSDLQAQIKALYAQISALQEKLQSAQQTTGYCFTVTKDLKVGDQGDAVKNLQQALNKLGYFNGAIDGIYGELTASALTGFQEGYRSEILTPIGMSHGSGYLGNRTRQVLARLYPCGAVTVTATKPESDDSRQGQKIKPKISKIVAKGWDEGTVTANESVTLTGRGFLGSNSLIITRAVNAAGFESISTGFSSADGKTATFVFPNVGPATYKIKVENANGTSNARTIKVADPYSESATPRFNEISAKGYDDDEIEAGQVAYLNCVGCLSSNTIHIGDSYAVTIYKVSDKDIVFTVPSYIPAGTYTTYITNVNGTSNTRRVKVYGFGASDDTEEAPTCDLWTNKSSYTYGETIKLYWTTENATYGHFEVDTSGKDTLSVPGDKLEIKGYVEIPADVTGNPWVKLMVYGSAGKNSCQITIPISE